MFKDTKEPKQTLLFQYETKDEEEYDSRRSCSQQASRQSLSKQFRRGIGMSSLSDYSMNLSQDPNYINRTFVQRAFSPMGEGSQRGSIFTLCSVAIGAGVLALPFIFA